MVAPLLQAPLWICLPVRRELKHDILNILILSILSLWICLPVRRELKPTQYLDARSGRTALDMPSRS